MKNDVFTIGMGEYAFLDYETVLDQNIHSLQTPGIAHCFGLAMYSSKNGSIALAHADINKLNQIKYAVSEINSATQSKYDIIEFHTTEKGIQRCNEQSKEKTLEAIEKILEPNPKNQISKKINPNVVDLKATYNKGINTTDVQKQNIERLNTKIGIKSQEAQLTDELIYNPLNQ